MLLGWSALIVKKINVMCCVSCADMMNCVWFSEIILSRVCKILDSHAQVMHTYGLCGTL